jgi:hypothetical protein
MTRSRLRVEFKTHDILYTKIERQSRACDRYFHVRNRIYEKYSYYATYLLHVFFSFDYKG